MITKRTITATFASLAVAGFIFAGPVVSTSIAAGDSTPSVTKKKVVKKTVSKTKKIAKKKKKKVVRLTTYQQALADIKKWRYPKAATGLEKVVAKDPSNADAWNWLGYSLRKQKKFDESYDAYQKALALNADHVGAHEYLGDLYLQTDRMGKAQEQYATLRTLCPSGCGQLSDLEQAIVEVTLEDMSADQTKAVQTALKDNGFYNSTIDGDFGRGSRKALRAFQDANSIADAGVTSGTMAALGL
jgi:tetratricopeptide (TPR) repeat protein